MHTANTYLPTRFFSCFGLDPDTPAEDYEIHLVRTADPAYLPPDQEAWPLYYHAAMEALHHFPEAFAAVIDAVSHFADRLQGRRALAPVPPNTPRQPNQPNPLPTHLDLGHRTFFLWPLRSPNEPNLPPLPEPVHAPKK